MDSTADTQAHPYHRGRPGLWADALVLSVATVLVGVCFIIDGKGVTRSPSFDQAREAVRTVGVPAGWEMRVWGVLFLTLGVVAVVPLVCRNAPSMRRGKALAPAAVLWVWWAMMFATYAAGHQGFGLIGAVIWSAVAACLFVDASVYFQHARAGNGDARGRI